MRSTVLPFEPGERKKDRTIAPLPAQQKQTKVEKADTRRRTDGDDGHQYGVVMTRQCFPLGQSTPDKRDPVPPNLERVRDSPQAI
jgi:hypothetical protein